MSDTEPTPPDSPTAVVEGNAKPQAESLEAEIDAMLERFHIETELRAAMKTALARLVGNHIDPLVQLLEKVEGNHAELVRLMRKRQRTRTPKPTTKAPPNSNGHHDAREDVVDDIDVEAESAIAEPAPVPDVPVEKAPLEDPEAAMTARLKTTNFRQWDNDMIRAFVSRVRAEQAREPAGAIARTCKEFGVPDYKYRSLSESVTAEKP